MRLARNALSETDETLEQTRCFPAPTRVSISGMSESSSRRSSRRRRSSAASTSSLNSEWETRENFTYQDEASISGYLKCPICIAPFQEPVTSSSCSHTFCYSCIKCALTPPIQQDQREGSREPVIGSNEASTTNLTDPLPPSVCPECRTRVHLSDFEPAQSIVRNMVDALQVKCPHSKRGCTKVTERLLIRSHAVRDCEYAYVGEYQEASKSSSLEGEGRDNGRRGRRGKGRCECGEKVLKKDVESHKEAGCTAKWRKCEACDENVREPDLSVSQGRKKER